MTKITAFTKRNWAWFTSYRFDFLTNYSSLLLSLITFYFFSQYFFPETINNTDYFSYVVIGLGISEYMNFLMHNTSTEIRDEQLIGTFEFLFMAPASPAQIILPMSISSLLLKSIDFLIFILAGKFLFGATILITIKTITLGSIIIILSSLAYLGLGFLVSSLVVIINKGAPQLTSLLGGRLAYLLCGVFFPTDGLPLFLQKISLMIPLTHSLNAIRNIFLLNSFDTYLKDITILSFFAIILFTTGLIFFNYSVKISKKWGNIGNY